MTSRLPKTRRTLLVGFSVASLVGVAALSGFVATSASAIDVPVPGQFANVVTLQTGSTNVVKSYGDTPGSAAETQLLSSKSSNCTLVPEGDPIIGFGPDPATRGTVVGLRAGSIGVVDKLSGESCAQVTSRETLELTLPAAMSKAVLDVEVQKNAVIDATLTYGSGTNAVTVTRQLRSGEAALGQPEGSVFFSCLPGSVSSAPNSNDNCRWVIEGALFDKIVLTATAGQFSLEGGSDANVPVNPIPENAQEPEGAEWPTNLTYFKPASGINCNETVTLPGGGTTPTVTIRRVTDVGGSANCIPIPYSLTGAGGQFTFNKPLGATNAQFYIDVAWKAAVGGAVKTTSIDYLVGTPGPEIPLNWCPGVVFTANGGATNSTPLSAAQAGELPDQEPATALPVKEFACILDSDSTPPANGFVTITQRIYLLGDPIMRG